LRAKQPLFNTFLGALVGIAVGEAMTLIEE
jgi:hypothetical protein